jgi:hypothetical protein
VTQVLDERIPPGVILPQFAPPPTVGAIRLLHALGHAVLAEVPLRSGRRADLLTIDVQGLITIVEIKSCLRDFRGDAKWQDYLEWCDCFYFAVSPDFPREILPPDTGLIIADRHDGVVMRDCRPARLAPARRKTLTLRFAHLAAARLMNRESMLPPAV